MEHQTFKCGIALFTLVCGMNIALADTGHLLRFKRQTITDQQGFGYPVFNVLVPEKMGILRPGSMVERHGPASMPSDLPGQQSRR